MRVGGLFWSFFVITINKYQNSFQHFPLTPTILFSCAYYRDYIECLVYYHWSWSPSTQMCNIKWINISITKFTLTWSLTYHKTYNGSHLDLEHLRVILFLPRSLLLFVINMFVALYVVETYTMEIYLYIVNWIEYMYVRHVDYYKKRVMFFRFIIHVGLSKEAMSSFI